MAPVANLASRVRRFRYLIPRYTLSCAAAAGSPVALCRCRRDAWVGAANVNARAIPGGVRMTRHVRLLPASELGDSAGMAVQAVGRRHVQHFNDSNKRSGTWWVGRCRATGG